VTTPRNAQAETDYRPAATMDRLRETFPRGRFAKQADGMPILVARRRSLAGCHVYEHGPGTLGVFYLGRSRPWLRRLGGLVTRHLAGDGEGILLVRACPEAAKALRMFSRGRHTGTPPRPAQPPVSGPSGPDLAPDAPESTQTAIGADSGKGEP
jgi:hypothetical protein